MDTPIKDLLDLILDPKYLRPIIIAVAIVILVRNVLYLFLTDVTRMFEYGPQEVVEMVFDIEVPRLLMTVLWPIVFAVLNRVHESIKINPRIFYGCLVVHTVTCLVAVAIIFNEGCLYDEYVLASGETVYQGCNPNEYGSTVYGGAFLTVLSVVVSHYIYSVKNLFAEPANNGTQV
jgi:preprotein translocase subunit Sec61beta